MVNFTIMLAVIILHVTATIFMLERKNMFGGKFEANRTFSCSNTKTVVATCKCKLIISIAVEFCKKYTSCARALCQQTFEVSIDEPLCLPTLICAKNLCTKIFLPGLRFPRFAHTQTSTPSRVSIHIGVIRSLLRARFIAPTRYFCFVAGGSARSTRRRFVFPYASEA